MALNSFSIIKFLSVFAGGKFTLAFTYSFPLFPSLLPRKKLSFVVKNTKKGIKKYFSSVYAISLDESLHRTSRGFKITCTFSQSFG
jgi:hypothetical protein